MPCEIHIPSVEFYSETTYEFVEIKAQTLVLEHSLLSISKWESKWKKPFPLLNNKALTTNEFLDYIRCMTINKNVNPNIYLYLPEQAVKKIVSYLDDVPTATTFTEHGPKPVSRGRSVTSELIYSWMFSYHIPIDCEKWNINRLTTLIKICNIENSPPKKMSKKNIYKQNAALNAQRRKAMGSKG